jgi:hypothetical protein
LGKETRADIIDQYLIATFVASLKSTSFNDCQGHA